MVLQSGDIPAQNRAYKSQKARQESKINVQVRTRQGNQLPVEPNGTREFGHL